MIRPVELPRPLSQRPLQLLLRDAVLARVEGLVVLRDREGARHGIWLRAGYALGAHVAGRYDPLLELLRRCALLSASAHRTCVAALHETGTRSGALAIAMGGVAPARVRETLREQLVARVAALVHIAALEGYDAWVEPGAVPDAEQSVCMPLGSLLRRAEAAKAPDARPPISRDEARRQLRALAKQLHPDRHVGLDAAALQQLASQLAAATAAYHGFS